MIYGRHKNFKAGICLNRERILAFIYWQERADFPYKKCSFHSHPMLSFKQIIAFLLPRSQVRFACGRVGKRLIFSEYLGDRAEQIGQALSFWFLVKSKATCSFAGDTKWVVTIRREMEEWQNKSSWSVILQRESPRVKCHPKCTAMHRGYSIKPCLPPDIVWHGSHGTGMSAGRRASACQF